MISQNPVKRNSTSNSFRGWGYSLLLCLSLAWCVGIIAAPLLSLNHNLGVASWIARGFYSPVCHQEGARSYVLFGFPLSVCGRCAAIYFSFTFTVIVLPWFSAFRHSSGISLPLLIFMLLPMFLDVGLDAVGLVSNSMASRTVTGLVAGIGFALYIIPAWMTAWNDLTHRFQTPHPVRSHAYE